jgi:hypothetical protein
MIKIDGHAFVCSAIAGVLSTAIAHPFDTIAVYMSTNRPLPHSCSSLYRGLGPAIFQGAVIYGALLGGYETLLSLGLPMLIASALSAVPESLLRGPFEAIKNLQQTEHVPDGGWKGRARTILIGTLGTLGREVPGNIVYWHTQSYVRSHGGASWLAGAITGVTYTLAVYPIESMRTQMVTGVKKMRPNYRGLGSYFIRAVLMVRLRPLSRPLALP